MDNQPQNIIITGSARGIGRGLARYFLEKGNRVFLVDVEEEELTYCANVHLKEHAGRLRYAVANLRSPDETRETIKKAADFFNNRIDVLINNASIASPHWKDKKTMADEETLEEWQAYIETNLTAPFVLSQTCIPYMKARNDAELRHINTAGSCIILIGSFRARMSDLNQECYAATKAGQLGLMHSMAISLSQWGIRVNLIAPGRVIASHENKEGDEKGVDWEDLLKRPEDQEDHAANRAGGPEDIAKAAEYLIGAGFVTGQDINVDGGALITK